MTVRELINKLIELPYDCLDKPIDITACNCKERKGTSLHGNISISIGKFPSFPETDITFYLE